MNRPGQWEEPVDEAVVRTQRAYDQCATAYDTATHGFHSLVTYPCLLQLLTQRLGGLTGRDILDIGCGTGGLMELLSREGARCTGLDVSPAFVRMARERGHTVEVGSMHAMPFADQKFDAVVSNMAWNYLPPDGQALMLREVRRVLRPQGVYVASCLHPWSMRCGNPAEYFHVERIQVMHQLGQEFRLYLLDWPEIVNLLIGSGLAVNQLQDAEVPPGLAEFAASAPTPELRALVESFAHRPYGMFVVARREQ